ncbi:hypothetical protein OGAPHI_003943 [Ogataea philodendri]|uniref:Protein kinase domain-containing protein n=1 Tax=Ogataea philodendri TaxID=1378263 RepID=A0A9P8P658_9ASCO|nr:uncharacterized protein OGAPHI_003943 [Ogataea philodendri]KAH3665755.1 hypothetical protein OGAPHI_003943 [Ogataea philodendri]
MDHHQNQEPVVETQDLFKRNFQMQQPSLDSQQHVLTGLQQMSLPNSQPSSSSVTNASSESPRLTSRLSMSHQRLPSLPSLAPSLNSYASTSQIPPPSMTPSQYRATDVDINQTLKRHQSETNSLDHFRNPWFGQKSIPRLAPLNTQVGPEDSYSPLLMQTPTRPYSQGLPTTFENSASVHPQYQIIPPSRINAPPPIDNYDQNAQFGPGDFYRRQSVAAGYFSRGEPAPKTALPSFPKGVDNDPESHQLYSPAPKFRRIESASNLRPLINAKPKYRRASSSKTFISPLRALTTSISVTYSMCKPEFDYRSSKNPKRVLTKPSQPKSNNGNDNEDSDYILYVNDVLGTEENRKYMVLDLLGQGTFGQVVKCQDLKTQEIVAIKVVKSTPVYLNQSLTEANILEHLNKKIDPEDKHHFLRLQDKFVHKNHLCLVFELLSSNLYDLIRQNQFNGLTIKLIRKLSVQLLDALCVLKDAGLIHCDLKPENISLVSLDKPDLKVIDFGSACHERQIFYTYIQSRFYRSPEVMLGLSYSSSVDMWSLGCIIAELFLGLPIFPGSSEYNQLYRIIQMLGMPPIWMLDMAKNSKNFMNKIEQPNGKHIYQLKSMEQYSREFNVNETPGKDYFEQRYLQDIIMNYRLPKKNMTQQMVDKEMAQRRCLSHFLHGVLNLNPLERWTPHEAILHPFITEQPFTGVWNPPSKNLGVSNSANLGGLNPEVVKKPRSKSFGNI